MGGLGVGGRPPGERCHFGTPRGETDRPLRPGVLIGFADATDTLVAALATELEEAGGPRASAAGDAPDPDRDACDHLPLYNMPCRGAVDFAIIPAGGTTG